MQWFRAYGSVRCVAGYCRSTATVHSNGDPVEPITARSGPLKPRNFIKVGIRLSKKRSMTLITSGKGPATGDEHPTGR